MLTLKKMRAAVLALAAIVGSFASIAWAPAGALFASLTTEAPNLTWQRVDTFLSNVSPGIGATPGARAMFRSFKSFLMQQRGEVKLQMITFGDLTADTNPLDGAVRIYAVYVRKQATATDAWYKIFDDASDDSTAADAVLALPILESGKESIAFFPDGFPLPTGLVHGSYTAFLGFNNATPSTTGDGPNGFVLVGA